MRVVIFPVAYDDIVARVNKIDPVKYATTRNYENGALTFLSPYISRGVISTKFVLKSLQMRGFAFAQVEKLVQELAWRDYWQQVWIEKGDGINRDLKRPQEHVLHNKIPTAIVTANTGIEAVDLGISELQTTGYMHNHMRMYVAAITCNIGKSHWSLPSKWMYSELLDGDWASNTLSWQWVAGSNANKKYFANQDNINKYFNSSQKGTYLDTSYEELPNMSIPAELEELSIPKFKTTLPSSNLTSIDNTVPTLIYNYYNLDPNWKKDLVSNRVLLLEPSVFSKYPISTKCIDFLIALANNIPGIRVYTGEFDDFVREFTPRNVFYKEHPFNQYSGQEEKRDWMFNVSGYYPSFFAFWKKCKKEIKNWDQLYCQKEATLFSKPR